MFIFYFKRKFFYFIDFRDGQETTPKRQTVSGAGIRV